MVEANWGCGEGYTGPAFIGLLFAYDGSTGALVAAVEVASLVDATTDTMQTCLGGPSTMDVLTGCGGWSSCGLLDAGDADR